MIDMEPDLSDLLLHIKKWGPWSWVCRVEFTKFYEQHSTSLNTAMSIDPNAKLNLLHEVSLENQF
jgi:hypothetical protein